MVICMIASQHTIVALKTITPEGVNRSIVFQTLLKMHMQVHIRGTGIRPVELTKKIAKLPKILIDFFNGLRSNDVIANQKQALTYNNQQRR